MQIPYGFFPEPLPHVTTEREGGKHGDCHLHHHQASITGGLTSKTRIGD